MIATATMNVTQREIYYRRTLAYSIYDDFHRLLTGEGVQQLPKFQPVETADSSQAIQQVELYNQGISFKGPMDGPERPLLFFTNVTNTCLGSQVQRQALSGVFAAAKRIIDEVELFSSTINRANTLYWSVSCIDSTMDDRCTELTKGTAKMKLARLLHCLYCCAGSPMQITVAFGKDYCVIYDS